MKTILKISFDKCIVGVEKRGAAEAPDVIQKLVAGKIKDAIWKEIEIAGDFETTQNNITKAALEAYEKGIVAGIGGDHSVTYGLIKAFAKTQEKRSFSGPRKSEGFSREFPNSGLIVFDAHLDCEDDFLPPTHEDIIRAAVNEKLFKKIFVVGVRNYTKKQQEFAMNNFSWDSAEVSINAIKEHIKEEVLDIVDDVYVSIDIDVFDPEFAPGTGHPEKDGFSPEQLLPVIKGLIKSGKVKGFDIVEVNPKKDINDKTSRLAAKLLIGFLGAASSQDI